MPSVKEIYSKISDVTIDADSINLNTDTVESLLSTVQADIALIKADMANGVLVNGTVGLSGGSVSISGGYIDHLRDGDGNIFGLDRSFPVDVQNLVITYPAQGATVSNTNFTSATSATLASAVAFREVLTVHNEGPATLFINAGTSASTTSYQVRLLAGDYWEAPAGQQSLQHSGIFSSAGSTARVTQVS